MCLCVCVHVTIRSRKTKIMAVLPTHPTGQQQSQPPRQVQLQGTDESVETADKLEYLGSVYQDSDCMFDKKSNAWISKASHSSRSQSKVF